MNTTLLQWNKPCETSKVMTFWGRRPWNVHFSALKMKVLPDCWFTPTKLYDVTSSTAVILTFITEGSLDCPSHYSMPFDVLWRWWQWTVSVLSDSIFCLMVITVTTILTHLLLTEPNCRLNPGGLLWQELHLMLLLATFPFPKHNFCIKLQQFGKSTHCLCGTLQIPKLCGHGHDIIWNLLHRNSYLLYVIINLKNK